MSGLFGIGGSSTKTDRGNQLSSWGDLSSLTNATSAAGGKGVAAGQQGLGQAQSYFSSLLSNEPGKVAQAVSPQVSAITGQAQQTRQTASEFGNRSGGTNAIQAAQPAQESAQVTNLINTLIPQAATNEANVASSQGNLGATLYGQAGSTAGTLGTLTEGAREVDIQQQNQLGQSAGQLAMMALLA